MRNVTILLDAKNTASREIKTVNADLKGLASNADSMAMALATVPAALGALGIVQLGGAIVQLAEMGAQAQRLEASFASASARVGQSASEMLSAMRAASRGAISDSALMQAANRAMLLGVADSGQEMAALLEVASARARAMGLTTQQAFDDLVTGLGRMSPMILDNLGIVTGGEAVFARYADSIGKSVDQLTDAEKKQALLQTVLTTSLPMVQDMATGAEDNALAFEQWTAATANLKDELGNLVSNVTPAIERLTLFITVLNQIAEGLSYWSDSGDTTAEKLRKIASAMGDVDTRNAVLVQMANWLSMVQGEATDTAQSVDSLSATEQVLAQMTDQASAALAGQSVNMDVLNSAATSARRTIAGLASDMMGMLGAQGAIAYADQLNSELGEQVRLWQDMGMGADNIANILIPSWLDQQRQVTRETGRTAAVVETVNREYESLVSKVQGVLGQSWKLDVGVSPGDFLPREDAINEDARRLADVMVNGFASPWAAYFQEEFPALFQEMTAGGDIQGAAASILREFENGLRPELIDKEKAKERVRALILGEQTAAELAQEIATELSAEMGIAQGTALTAARGVLGAGPTAESGQVAGDEFGAAVLASVSGDEPATSIVSTLGQKITAKAALIEESGRAVARAWGNAFLTVVGENVPAGLVDILLMRILPALTAAQAGQTAAQGAK